MLKKKKKKKKKNKKKAKKKKKKKKKKSRIIITRRLKSIQAEMGLVGMSLGLRFTAFHEGNCALQSKPSYKNLKA